MFMITEAPSLNGFATEETQSLLYEVFKTNTGE